MTGKAPLIGVTTYGRNEENKFDLPAEYVEAVRRAHGLPVLLTPGESRWQQILGHIDGLLLAGGGDLHPSCYGGAEHETIYMTDAERDETELALARYAVERGIPTLGICRGAQVLNVALGGSLHEHLPDVVGEEIAHRAPPREPIPHAVKVRQGSLLGSILKQLEFSCASWHHQALRDVAPGFDVVAHAPDGTIEAVEMREHPWLVAVQWHPELTAAEDVVQQRIFDAFVRATQGG